MPRRLFFVLIFIYPFSLHIIAQKVIFNEKTIVDSVVSNYFSKTYKKKKIVFLMDSNQFIGKSSFNITNVLKVHSVNEIKQISNYYLIGLPDYKYSSNGNCTTVSLLFEVSKYDKHRPKLLFLIGYYHFEIEKCDSSVKITLNEGLSPTTIFVNTP